MLYGGCQSACLAAYIGQDNQSAGDAAAHPCVPPFETALTILTSLIEIIEVYTRYFLSIFI